MVIATAWCPNRPRMKRLVLVVAFVLLFAPGALAGPAEQCAQVGNDDTVRPYDPSLRPGLLKAYARLFPRARMPPDDQAFQAGAHIRCMDGRLLACFTGANLPCGKMNTDRNNKGAQAFCRENRPTPFVPAFATGHDSAYTYRCVAGHAEISGETFKFDSRGFAASVWAPIE
jgi:hypothetical protein